MLHKKQRVQAPNTTMHSATEPRVGSNTIFSTAKKPIIHIKNQKHATAYKDLITYNIQNTFKKNTTGEYTTMKR